MSSYDYVIVGAGSAGCVLAARLTEDPGRQRPAARGRAARRRGPHPHPGGVLGALPHPATTGTWRPATSRELNDRRVYLPRGKMLGGSSSINAMIYIRGNRARLRRAGADQDGCDGWGYDDLLPYFLQAPRTTSAARARTTAMGGPLRRHRTAARATRLSEAVHRGRRGRVGLPATEDFNGDQQDGVGWYQVTHARRPARQHRGLLPAPGRRTGRTSRCRPGVDAH